MCPVFRVFLLLILSQDTQKTRQLSRQECKKNKVFFLRSGLAEGDSRHVFRVFILLILSQDTQNTRRI
jgi:hypothetical protein